MSSENNFANCSSALCPLNRIKVGIEARVKRLCASPELCSRLRELGFCEERVVKLLAGSNNIICLICNVRLALNEQIAQQILVEPVFSGSEK